MPPGVVARLDSGAAPRPPEPIPQQGDAGLRLLRRIGVVDPSSLDDYRAHGGYTALARAIEMGGEAVIAEVTASKLMGRVVRVPDRSQMGSRRGPSRAAALPRVQRR
jgi:NADH-quinone oxidoreductase subunit F